MKPYCLNCRHYTPEYQGYADYINFCLIKKHCVSMEAEGCPLWEAASAETMESRYKLWRSWEKLKL